MKVTLRTPYGGDGRVARRTPLFDISKNMKPYPAIIIVSYGTPFMKLG
jgi:hypothetical protein